MKFWCQQFSHSETYQTLDPHDRHGLKPSDIRQVGSARALGCWQNHTQQYSGLGLWPSMVEKRFLQISGPKMTKSYMVTHRWKCWIYTSAMLLKWAGVIDQVSGQPWDHVKKGLTSMHPTSTLEKCIGKTVLLPLVSFAKNRTQELIERPRMFWKCVMMGCQ